MACKMFEIYYSKKKIILNQIFINIFTIVITIFNHDSRHIFLVIKNMHTNLNDTGFTSAFIRYLKYIQN